MSGRGMRASIAEIAAEARDRRAQVMGRAQRREDGVLVCPALYAEGFVGASETMCLSTLGRGGGQVPRRKVVYR